jgi:hypothetical protein
LIAKWRRDFLISVGSPVEPEVNLSKISPSDAGTHAQENADGCAFIWALGVIGASRNAIRSPARNRAAHGCSR